jgi:molecular chaperone GrpE
MAESARKRPKEETGDIDGAGADAPPPAAEPAAKPPGEAEAPPPAAAESPPPPAPEPAPAAGERELALEAEVAALRDKLLRALAEAENTRRRAQREVEDASRFAIAAFARELLTVADNFQRALASVDETAKRESPAMANLLSGVELTQRELAAVLARFAITPVEAIGKRFDHNVHEALFEVEDKDKPAGTVCQVIEQGYLLNGRLLRPAKVGITKGGPKEEPAKAEGAAPEPAAPAEVQVKAGQAAYEKQAEAAEPPGARLDEKL